MQAICFEVLFLLRDHVSLLIPDPTNITIKSDRGMHAVVLSNRKYSYGCVVIDTWSADEYEIKLVCG